MSSLAIVVHGAGVAGDQPWVDLEITGQTAYGATRSLPPDEIPMSYFEFTLARLVEVDGYRTWQSLLNTVAAGPRAGPHSRLQAAGARGSAVGSSWENRGAGVHRYFFPVDVTQTPAQYSAEVLPAHITEADWAAYDPSDTFRVVVLLRPSSNWDASYDSLDFVPAGGAPEIKKSAATESCNACHDTLTYHGGNRIGMENCSTCHNQFTFNSFTDAPTASDLAYIGHELHSAGGQTGSEPNLRPRWTGVGYSRDLRSCIACHDPAAAPSAADAFARPSIQACGSCHDGVNFETGEGHLAGAHPSNSTCAGCHATGAFFGADVVHAVPTREFARAGGLRYQLDGLVTDGDTLTVTWRAIYGEDSIVHQTAPWTFSSSVRLLIGWGDTDFFHAAPASGRPGEPLSIPIVASLGSGTTTESGGVYTTVVDLSGTSHAGASSLVASVGGTIAHATQGNLIPTDAVSYDGPARRTIVTNDRCFSCHEDRQGAFAKHGPGVHNEIGRCNTCHTSNSTDIDRRRTLAYTGPLSPGDAGPDGKVEQPTSMMMMVHGVHAAGAGARSESMWIAGRYNWTLYDSTRSYPGRIANCAACHEGTSYYPPSPDIAPRGTTIDTRELEVAVSDVDLHWKESAARAACASCHTTRAAIAHMDNAGSRAGTGWDQAALDSSSYETCATCHGPGRQADVRVVHGVK